MNPAFSDEAWQAYVASQPVVDYDALALEENARMGPFQTGTGATSTQEGIDELTAFVEKCTKRPAEEERDVFGRNLEKPSAAPCGHRGLDGDAAARWRVPEGWAEDYAVGYYKLGENLELPPTAAPSSAPSEQGTFRWSMLPEDIQVRILESTPLTHLRYRRVCKFFAKTLEYRAIIFQSKQPVRFVTSVLDLFESRSGRVPVEMRSGMYWNVHRMSSRFPNNHVKICYDQVRAQTPERMQRLSPELRPKFVRYLNAVFCYVDRFYTVAERHRVKVKPLKDCLDELLKEAEEGVTAISVV